MRFAPPSKYGCGGRSAPSKCTVKSKSLVAHIAAERAAFNSGGLHRRPASDGWLLVTCRVEVY